MTVEFFNLLGAVLLAFTDPGTERLQEPVPDFVVADPDAAEQRQQLLIELLFVDACWRMLGLLVVGAEVVDVVLGAQLGLLRFTLPAHRPAAVGAGDQAAAEDQLVRAVDDPAEQALCLVEGGPIHERLVRALHRFAAVRDFADVGAVLQDTVEHRPRELTLGIRVSHAFAIELLNQRVQRVPVVGVQVKDPPDPGPLPGIDLDQTTPVDTDVDVAVGCPVGEQPVLHPAFDAVLDVNRHLLGVERRHVGQGATHHPPGRGVLGRLGDVDDFEAPLLFKPFELDVVEEVACGAVHLEEQQPVELVGVLSRVGQHRLERLAFLVFAGGLGDSEELDDFPAVPLGPLGQGLLLHIEGEALTCLLPAGDPGQGDVALA